MDARSSILLINPPIYDFAAMNKIYAGFFKEPFPAQAIVAVKGLPKGAKVEISTIAMK